MQASRATTLLLALAGTLVAGAAAACSCRPCGADPWPLVEGTAVIFNARVLAERRQGSERLYDVSVTVLRKGFADARLTLRTPASSAACGVSGLAVGTDYLFMASPADRGGLGIDACGMACAQSNRSAIEDGLKPCAPGGPCPGDPVKR
jgi:hypothetical protein